VSEFSSKFPSLGDALLSDPDHAQGKRGLQSLDLPWHAARRGHSLLPVFPFFYSTLVCDGSCIFEELHEPSQEARFPGTDPDALSDRADRCGGGI
jgi:hypothetical protein